MNKKEKFPRAAVIDVGSNTIKVLAGEHSTTGLRILHDSTAECRISEGLYTNPPTLAEAAMDSAIQAICGLLDKIAPLEVGAVEIVATSAVRDAVNRDQFLERVARETGYPAILLSGKEEAQGIAEGIATEPAVHPASPYTVSDLGGGSLEWIYRAGGEIVHMTSMNIGAVRMMSRFIKNPEKPIHEEKKEAIRSFCIETLETNLPEPSQFGQATHWGTGGAFTLTRLLLATEKGVPLLEQSSQLPLAEIRRIEGILSSLPLMARKAYPGLPSSRADILPVALLIIQSIAEFSGADCFHHSFCNLRMGRLQRLLLSTSRPSSPT